MLIFYIVRTFFTYYVHFRPSDAEELLEVQVLAVTVALALLSPEGQH